MWVIYVSHIISLPSPYFIFPLLQAIDMGDSMFVHAFGAYFGLAVSLMLHRRDASTEKEGSSYQSDLFAMIGESSIKYSFLIMCPFSLLWTEE